MRLRPRASVFLLVAMLCSVGLAACGDDDDTSGATAASTAASAGGSAPVPTGEPLVIGSVGDFSGTFGLQYSRGPAVIEAWAQMVNAAGGINGHPVEVRMVDDHNDPAQSLSALRDLIENQGAIAIVGAYAPGTDAAWSEYITEQQVPVIGGLSATSSVWYENPYFFPAQNRAAEYVAFSFYVALRAGGQTAGVLTCSEFSVCTEGISLFESSADAAGIGYGTTVGLPVAAPDYTAQCLELRDNDVDFIIPLVSQTITLKAVQDCDRQGYEPGLLLPDSPAPDVLGDDIVQGAYLALPSPMGWNDSPLTAQFRAAMAEYAPDVSLNEWGGTTGWQAALLFGEAVRNIGEHPTAADVIAGLHALPAEFTNSGWSPPLTFVEGQPATTGTAGWIGLIEDGQLTAPFGPDAIAIGS